MTAPERIRVAQDADGFWTCREAISGSQEYVRADIYEASLSVPAAAVVGEPVDDWTVDDTETAGEILTLLGIGCDASKEPGADWRRDKIAKLIRARISQQDAELERLRREVEEAREDADEWPDQHRTDHHSGKRRLELSRISVRPRRRADQ